MEENKNEIVNVHDTVSTIDVFDNKMKQLLTYYGLPTENVTSSIRDRENVVKNLENLFIDLDNRDRDRLYLSKFVYSITVGLFEAGLVYIWNETIKEIRKKIIDFDFGYFKDQLSKDTLKNENDIDKITDFDLIEGFFKIDMISEKQWKTLNHIRDMRNHFSIAHPNEEVIKWTEIMSWFNSCLEIINLKTPAVGAKIKQFFSNIEESKLEENYDVDPFIKGFDKRQANGFLKRLHGMYRDKGDNQILVNNIEQIVKIVWNNEKISDETKQEIGFKYNDYIQTNQKDFKERTKKFINLCEGQKYLTEDTKIYDIRELVDSLWDTHNSMNNFYNEPPIVRTLIGYLKSIDFSIPEKLNVYFTEKLINISLGNVYGVSFNAQPHYYDLLERLSNDNKKRALILFVESQSIKNKLTSPKVRDNVNQILERLQEDNNENITTLLNNIKKGIENKQELDTSENKRLVETIKKEIK